MLFIELNQSSLLFYSHEIFRPLFFHIYFMNFPSFRSSVGRVCIVNSNFFLIFFYFDIKTSRITAPLLNVVSTKYRLLLPSLTRRMSEKARFLKLCECRENSEHSSLLLRWWFYALHKHNDIGGENETIFNQFSTLILGKMFNRCTHTSWYQADREKWELTGHSTNNNKHITSNPKKKTETLWKSNNNQ